MLAKEAERFRSGADGDRGSSEAPEPKSQRKRRVCAAHHSGRAGAERSEPSRSEVSAGRSRNGAPVGAGAFEDACWNPWLLRYEPPSEDGHSPTLAVRDLGGRFGNNRSS